MKQERTSKDSPLVFGLTGQNASGKGEVAKALGSLGFAYFSLSDILREEAAARGIDPIRENMVALGTELRAQFGEAVLADRIRDKLPPRAVVDSVRHPAEVESLKDLPKFFLVHVSAPLSVRHSRSLRRGRPGDGTTLEAFSKQDKVEKAGSKAAPQLEACARLADREIVNDGLLKDLEDKVKSIVEDCDAGQK